MRTYGSHNPLTQTLTAGLLGLTLLGAMVAGCSSTSARVQQSAATQPTGSVRLEEVADWEFEATHPSAIDATTLNSLLRGIRISETHLDLSNLPVDGSKPMRVFSDEDVRYLAPLLAQALSQAQPEYVVAFRLSSSAGSGSEPTAGTLYVRNERLYLTLSEHHGTLSKIESSWFGGGRPARVVTIAPESAGQIEQALPSIGKGRQDLKSLAIHYSVFAKQPEPGLTMTAGMTAPAPQPVQSMPARIVVASAAEEQLPQYAPSLQRQASEMPVVLSSPSDDDRLNDMLQELQDARQAMTRKDAKINALRRDLESMRTQLETRDKELRAVKTNKQTQPKRDKRNNAELIIR
ncbi:MAG: hypothetical protein H0V35_01175 [Nitrospira sp.]|nr:hypothetical protein [Nitrospira sp.]